LKSKLILGLDIGTSSVRAALYDARGKLIPDTLVKNERTLTATDDGGAEIDADVAFEQIVRTIDDVIAKSESVSDDIDCVATAAFWHSLVGVDEKGRATTKVLGWADTRSRKYTELLRKKLDETEIHNRTGARFHSSFWPAKILYLKAEHKTTSEKTAKWLSLSDYVSMRLHDASGIEHSMPSIARSKVRWQFPGVPLTSVSMASATGLLNIRTQDWDEELLDFIGLFPSNFPQIVDLETRQLLNKDFVRRWPKLKHAEWMPAVGDGAANNVGAGCVTKSKAALMIGTSGAMRVAYRGEPPEQMPPGLWCYRIDRDRVIIGGALSDGGGLYHWLKENLDLGDDDRIEKKLSSRNPGEHGLTFLPFLAGERSTGYNETARGAILGLRSSTDTIDIVQAALESVAFRFAEIFDQLNSVCRIRDVIASGGALRESHFWTQMIADLLGRDMTLPNTHEASMRGAVLLALETTGRIKKIEDIPTPTGKIYTADRRRKKLYEAARKLHQGAYRELIDRETS
jgi:gluconokinase